MDPPSPATTAASPPTPAAAPVAAAPAAAPAPVPAPSQAPRRPSSSQRRRFVDALLRTFAHHDFPGLAEFGLDVRLDLIVSPELPSGVIARELVSWAEANEMVAALDAEARRQRPAMPVWWPNPQILRDSPYRGLSTFQERDADVFFGRDDFTGQLLHTVRQRSFVAVVGPSSSGKSSVVFAGLLPALRAAGGWQVVTCRPASDSPEGNPFDALAGVLIPLLHPDLTDTRQQEERGILKTALQEGSVNLGNILRSSRARQPDAPHLLLIADQFEEIFTPNLDEATRRDFLAALLAALPPAAPSLGRPPPLVLLATMRRDFMSQALTYPALTAALQAPGATLKLGPMSQDELRQVIEQPARTRQVTLDPGLTERILEDVGEEPGNLPLLEFALTRLWEEQEDGRLTHTAYEEIGGVEGALATYAEEVIAGLGVESDHLRQVFTQMVRPGEGTIDTRRPARQSELTPAAWELAQQLAATRLVVTGHDELTGANTVELAHEALIRNWPTLRGWIDQDRDFRRWQERLRADVRDWEELPGDTGTLLRGAPLAVAGDWCQDREAELAPTERAFIAASLAAIADEEQAAVAQRQAVERANAARRQKILAGLIAGMVVVGLFAVIAGWQWRLADQARQDTLDQIQIGESLQLAQLARSWVDDQLDLALLLGLEAIGKSRETEEAQDSLLTGMAASPYLSAILSEHGDQVTSLGISADSDVLATGGADGTVTLWDLASNDPLGAPLGVAGSGAVRSLAFSPRPEERVLAVGTLDGGIALWDIDDALTAHERLPLAGHGDTVTSLAFSSDGRMLASGGADATTILWDVASGDQRALAAGHSDAIMGLAFAPDDETLVSAGQDGTIRFWDVATGQPDVPALEPNLGAILSVAISPLPSASLMATGGADGSIALWDLNSRTLRTLLPGHDTAVRNLGFSANGQTLASGSAERIILWTITPEETAERRMSLPRGLREQDEQLMEQDEQLTAIALAPDGGSVVSAAFDGAVMRWDTAQPFVFHTELGAFSEVTSVAFSPAGDTPGDSIAVTSDRSRSVMLSSVSAPPALRSLGNHQEPPRSVAFAPDGQSVASGSADRSVILWDTASGQPAARCTGHAAPVTSVAFSDDRVTQTLASGDESGGIILWTVTGADCQGTPVTPEGAAVTSLAFSPGGETLAAGKQDGTILLHDVATIGTPRPPQAPLAEEGVAITSLAFSPLGQTRLIAGRWDGAVIVWNWSTRSEREELNEHESAVTALSVSSHGRGIAASGSTDGTVILWNLSTGQPIVPPLAAGIGPVQTVAFAPSGQLLVSGGRDGLVVWNLDLDSWQRLACARANRDLSPDEWDRYFRQEQRRDTCATESPRDADGVPTNA